VGYRGKLEAQDKARALRHEHRTLQEIADILGVSKSSVSLWCRDIDVEIRRRQPVARRPHAQHLAKLAEIAECDELGRRRLAVLSEQGFLAVGVALYAGEGAKRDGKVTFANTDARIVRLFCLWLRRFFTIHESRLRVRVYLHEGLDIDASEQYWSAVTAIPRSQFTKPYRAVADASIRKTKHQHGCVYVEYTCARTHRELMGLVRALLTSSDFPG
jgi:hypothetical protein